MKDAPVTHMYEVVTKTHTLHQVTNTKTGDVIYERMSYAEAVNACKVANKAYFAGWLDGGSETCEAIKDSLDGLGENQIRDVLLRVIQRN